MDGLLVFTSKHHDGYANFNSSYTFGWNSMSVGSQRNVIKDLKDAFQAKDPEFHFGIYYSLFEWFNPLYLKDKNGNFQTRYANGSSVFQVSYLSNLFFELGLYLGVSSVMEYTLCSRLRRTPNF